MTACRMCREDRPLSREHVLPQWLSRAMDPTTLVKHTYEIQPGGDIRREWSSTGLSIVSRSVCVRCNNGWMAQLESTAEPVLAPLVLGKPSLLTTRASAIAARWFLKTAFMLDLAGDPGVRVVDDGVAPWCITGSYPRSRVSIWMGASRRFSALTAGRSATIAVNDEPSRPAWMYLMLLGHLVLAGLVVEQDEDHAPMLTGVLQDFLVPLAPQQLVCGFPPKGKLRRRDTATLMQSIATAVC